MSNVLAKGALYACARLAGGYLKDAADASPPNNAVQEALSAMLTPYLVRQLGVWTPEHLLKVLLLFLSFFLCLFFVFSCYLFSLCYDLCYDLQVLTNNTSSPVLVWDNGTRGRLLDFLAVQAAAHVRSGEPSDPTYGATYVHDAYAEQLIVGGVFVSIYNRQPDFTLDDPARFVVDLLDLLLLHHHNSPSSCSSCSSSVEQALESLYHVVKAVPSAGLQCLGRFQLLFQMMAATNDNESNKEHNNGAHFALQVVSCSCSCSCS